MEKVHLDFSKCTYILKMLFQIKDKIFFYLNICLFEISYKNIICGKISLISFLFYMKID